jgi:hypothetical protein
MDQVNLPAFTRLSKSNMEMSDHIVVLTAIVGAMVTRASVDYERLEECVNFAAKRYRAGKRSAFLQKASSVLHDLEAMQKALGVENRKLRNGRKRAAAVGSGLCRSLSATSRPSWRSKARMTTPRPSGTKRNFTGARHDGAPPYRDHAGHDTTSPSPQVTSRGTAET